MNPDDDAHLHEIKTRMIAADNERKEKYKERYKKNQSFDPNRGTCCCRYKNKVGARYVHILDMFFLPMIIRFVFAIWAHVDPERIYIYVRVRKLTTTLGWPLGLCFFVGWSLWQVLE